MFLFQWFFVVVVCYHCGKKNRVLPAQVNHLNDMTLKHPKVRALLIRLSQEIAPNLITLSIGFLPPCQDVKGRMGSMMAHS